MICSYSESVISFAPPSLRSSSQAYTVSLFMLSTWKYQVQLLPMQSSFE